MRAVGLRDLLNLCNELHQLISRRRADGEGTRRETVGAQTALSMGAQASQPSEEKAQRDITSPREAQRELMKSAREERRRAERKLKTVRSARNKAALSIKEAEKRGDEQSKALLTAKLRVADSWIKRLELQLVEMDSAARRANMELGQAAVAERVSEEFADGELDEDEADLDVSLRDLDLSDASSPPPFSFSLGWCCGGLGSFSAIDPTGRPMCCAYGREPR